MAGQQHLYMQSGGNDSNLGMIKGRDSIFPLKYVCNKMDGILFKIWSVGCDLCFFFLARLTTEWRFISIFRMVNETD